MKPQREGPFSYIPVNRRPLLKWPNEARVAVWVIPNIESFALDEKIIGDRKIPEVQAFSQRDYGARIGIYRIMDIMSQRKIRGSITLNSEVCDVYPEIIQDAMALQWEFLGHNQSNTRRLHDIPPHTEAKVIHDALDRITNFTGVRPRGWLGSGLSETWNTLDYLANEGIEYVCDWVNDDQPYYMDVDGYKMINLPYTAEINDLPQFRLGRSNEEFDAMAKAAFDRLYLEGDRSARVMAIAIHPFVIGVSHRIWVLESILDYISGHDKVWFATGSEIIDAWRESGATF